MAASHVGANIRRDQQAISGGEVLRVTYQASGHAPAPPAELAALLAATNAPEREEAWAAFVRAYTDRMLRAARTLGGDRDSVMDRYTFVLERLREDDFRRLRAYVRPGAGEFTLWLMVVTRRLCLDHYRERYGRPGQGGGHARAGRRRLVDLVADRTDPTTLADRTGAGPDEVLTRRERLQALGRALEGLSPADRLLLRFRFSQELPAREIARLMGFPTVFHVYRRLDKILRELRSTLTGMGLEAES
jgi:RNA polymerase sigma factor (sigma-70 family)